MFITYVYHGHYGRESQVIVGHQMGTMNVPKRMDGSAEVTMLLDWLKEPALFSGNIVLETILKSQ